MITPIKQKKLQLSDVQKDVKKRLTSFEAHRSKLNALRSKTAVKPKPKSVFGSIFGL